MNHSVKQLGLDVLANFLGKIAFIQKWPFPTLWFESWDITINIKPVMSGIYFPTLSKEGHHQPASEPPFEWHFAGGPMVARLCVLAGMCVSCIENAKLRRLV